ncbi:MAG: hypothetical protein Q7S73_01365 [bacterium]|nr:hypothetical protein [bacterium]
MVLMIGIVAVLGSGCATLPQGSLVTVRTTGFTFFQSKITAYNNAGQNVTIQPFSSEKGFVAEYQLGKRDWACLWLCRKKIPTKVFVLRHGDHLRIPMQMNMTGQYRQESIGLLIKERGRIIGAYSYCVYVPYDRAITEDIVFGPQELAELKQGNSGRPCRSGW